MMLYFLTELPVSPLTMAYNPHNIYVAINQSGYIYYTIDGSTPTSTSPFVPNYSYINLYSACTLKFVGVANGTWATAEKTEVYTVEVLMPAIPVITAPESYGTEFKEWYYFYPMSPIPVKFYWTNDGSLPTVGNAGTYVANSGYAALYAGIPWHPTLRIRAFDNWNRYSEVYEAGTLFTLAGTGIIASTDKPPGSYLAGDTIAIVSDKAKAQFYYTLDGTTPVIDDYGPYQLPRAGSTTFAYTTPLVLETTLDLKIIPYWAGGMGAPVGTLHFVADSATSSLRLPRGQETAIPNSTANMSLMIANDTNSMFIADESGNTHLASDIHIGPTQPLGDKKIWQDTTTMTMKVNNGADWVASATPVTPSQIRRDFGTFIPSTGPSFIVGEWTDITDIQFWDPAPGLAQEINGEFIGGEWVDTQGWDEVWLATVGSWVYENDAWTWMCDRVVSNEEYAMMDYWWKGLRFSQIKIFFEVGTGTGTGLRYEVYSNEYNDLVWVWESSTTDPLNGVVGEVPVSGKAYDVVWPDYGTPGFMSDFGGIDLWAGTGVSKITKIEILVSQVGG